MNEILDKLHDQIKRLDQIEEWDIDTLADIRNKLAMYLSKFFKNREEYKKMLNDIDISPDQNWKFQRSVKQMQSLITTLIEDIMMGDDETLIHTENERHKILSEARREIELERERIQNEAMEIQKMREELLNDRERFLAEEDKFNIFKTKLEVADKELDFQQQANNNKNTAYVWAIIASLLIGALIYILCDSLKLSDTFVNIAELVKKGISPSKIANNEDIISRTIFFSFSKYIFTKILLYSILIYAIVFCIKNYNAQMHNNIINTHKSNAFKSTLSLLNTARSDEGNDKLLVQATQAIFSHQMTGYSGKDSEQTSPNLVTNFIDSAVKKP